MRKIPAPNFNERAPGIALDYIVLHYTGMRDAAGALARMCDPSAEVSAHYMIDEDGEVTQLVEEDKRAWHAGKSFWRGISDINSASVGIELVNPGHEFGYRAFPDAQIAALIELLPPIIARHKMNSRSCLLAHSDIAPARKTDPGELFPWYRLALHGFGIWPVPTPADYAQVIDEDAASLLADIGYYNTSLVRDTLTAFQRRYYVEKISGEADAETMARLIALRRLLNAQTSCATA